VGQKKKVTRRVLKVMAKAPRRKKMAEANRQAMGPNQKLPKTETGSNIRESV
jgi:hypothetical protein